MTRFDADCAMRLSVENGVMEETADGRVCLTPEFSALLCERIEEVGPSRGLTSALIRHCPDCDSSQQAMMAVGVRSFLAFIGSQLPDPAGVMRRDPDARHGPGGRRGDAE